MTSSLHVVLGAAGGAGKAIIHELSNHGHTVRAVGRHPISNLPANVTFYQADLMNPPEVLAATEGADVVYHAVNTPYQDWPRTLPTIMDNVLAATAGKRLVYIDSLYACGEVDGPLHVGLPEAATGKKGKLRTLLAKKMRVAKTNGNETVILRFSDFIGPGFERSTLPASVIQGAANGKPLQWYVNADQPHAYSYLLDVGLAARMVALNPSAVGQTLHVPTAEPLTGREYAKVIGGITGKNVNLKVMSEWMIFVGGIFNPFVREFREETYQLKLPWIVHRSSFEDLFPSFVPTPHPEAFRAIIESGS